jgi:hypothetical protein
VRRDVSAGRRVGVSAGVARLAYLLEEEAKEALVLAADQHILERCCR